MCLESPAVCSLFPPQTSFCCVLSPSMSFSVFFLLFLHFSHFPHLLSSVYCSPPFLLFFLSPPSFICFSSPRVNDPVGLHRACPAPVAALPTARSPQAARVHQGTSRRGEETPVSHVKPRQRRWQPAGQSGGPLPGQRSLRVERGSVV